MNRLKYTNLMDTMHNFTIFVYHQFDTSVPSFSCLIFLQILKMFNLIKKRAYILEYLMINIGPDEAPILVLD